MGGGMRCEVFKSRKQQETYVYLEKGTPREDLPQILRDLMGELTFVMELEISEQTRLAREKPVLVLENIKKQGFHLQLAPKITTKKRAE